MSTAHDPIHMPEKNIVIFTKASPCANNLSTYRGKIVHGALEQAPEKMHLAPDN
jgi:hypothetical protein